jgi:PIN domain nuclease of toxin-antitoxin system
VLILIICDTHVLIFWQDNPQRLSKKASEAIKSSLENKSLACSDISLWEIAMLFKFGRLRNDISAELYMSDVILTMFLTVLPITPKIAVLSQQELFIHKDPADRLIVATSMFHQCPLITADSKLSSIGALDVIW